jgi:hypothetical protein
MPTLVELLTGDVFLFVLAVPVTLALLFGGDDSLLLTLLVTLALFGGDDAFLFVLAVPVALALLFGGDDTLLFVLAVTVTLALLFDGACASKILLLIGSTINLNTSAGDKRL